MAVPVHQRASKAEAPPASSPASPEPEAPNPIWQALAIRRPVVGAADDRAEREADRAAERVLMGERASGLGQAPVQLQRACCATCTSCEDDEPAPIRRASEAGQGRAVGLAPEPVARLLDERRGTGAGRPLEPALRREFEPRFGHDLSRVRVHTDSAATGAAQQLGARAFAWGSDVYFGSGVFRPQSVAGRRVLAHELAHVVQQRGGHERIQRDPDFRVTQVQPEGEEFESAGGARFFFELDRSDLREGVPAEAAELARLRAWASAHAGETVQLVGHASAEGAASHNQRLAQRRAETVARVLRAAGVVVNRIATSINDPERRVEYRYHRSVEVIRSGATDSCSSFTQAQRDADVQLCESAFATALTRAQTLTSAALGLLRHTPDPRAPDPVRDPLVPGRDQALQRRFPGERPDDVRADIEAIERRLGELGSASEHECQPRCVEGCNRPASAAAGGAVQLCPSFYVSNYHGQPMSADLRVWVVLHEGTHSADEGIDVAYARTRLFDVLEGADARQNADSHVVLILELANASAVLGSGSPAPADSFGFTLANGAPDQARNDAARRAIGYAEAWLNYAAFWTAGAYDWVHRSLSGWAGRGGLGHAMVELYAPLFGLAHPGPAGLPASDAPTILAFVSEVGGRGFVAPAPSDRARTSDRTRMAGIYDRLDRMHDAMGHDLAVGPSSAAQGQWSAASGLPGLGTSVLLPASFFGLSRTQQVREILRMQARALADVGPAWVEAYVEAAEGVRRFRGLGPR